MSADVPATEARSDATAGLDELDTVALVALLARESRRAFDAVEEQAGAIAAAVDAIVPRLRGGGALHYVGAGTSGRLGFLDAAEWLPTFGVEPGMVQAHLAGGGAALLRAVEGAEDDAEAGAAAMRERVAPRDAVVGISASGGAPFVVAALKQARELGAVTVAVSNVPGSPLTSAADYAIVVETGAEPIAGSTRMNAGTAQKLVLNAISTAAMVRLGKVHDNLMIDLVATNEKLRRRALRLVTALAGCDLARAAELLAAADGRVKVAVAMARLGVDASQARARLEAAGGSLREALR
jgi:N-acetylmuramic acid 6-phosphate etherase